MKGIVVAVTCFWLFESTVGVQQSVAPGSAGQAVTLDAQARELLQAGKFTEARALFQQEQKDAPLKALTGIGDSYVLAGDYAAGRAAYQHLLDVSSSPPERVDAQFRLAESFTYAGDYASARKALAAAHTIAVAAADLALEWAVVARQNAIDRFTDQLDQAEVSAAEMSGLAREPSVPEATKRDHALIVMEVLPMIAAKRGNEALALKEAEDLFRAREAASLSPKREMILGLVAAYLGHYAEAVENLERAPQRETNVYLAYWIGRSHEALGHSAEARAAYTRILEWRRTDNLSRLTLPLVLEPAKRQLRGLR
jgi:tetratricopeptide (TPR) repeat protein